MNNQPLTQENLDEMNNISSMEQMDKYLKTVENEKISDYWSWAKKTTEKEIDEYIDIQKMSATIQSKAAVILLNLATKCRFPA